MKISPRRVVLLTTLSLLASLTACTTGRFRIDPIESQKAHWRGRFAVRLGADLGQTETRSFSAAFALQGDTSAGDLQFFSPFGNTLAFVHWAPGSCQLEQNGQVHSYASLAQLMTDLFGFSLPESALFSWLQGRPQEIDGWRLNDSDLPQGKIVAKSLRSPTTEVRILLEP